MGGEGERGFGRAGRRAEGRFAEPSMPAQLWVTAALLPAWPGCSVLLLSTLPVLPEAVLGRAQGRQQQQHSIQDVLTKQSPLHSQAARSGGCCFI